MSDKDVEALKARVAELERAAKPERYIDDWVVPPPAIDRVGMSPSTLREFAEAVPDDVARGIARDARAPTGPSGAGGGGQITRVSTSPGIIGSNTGWAREVPLGPPPGLRYVDAQLDEQDRRDLDEKIMQEALAKAGEPK